MELNGALSNPRLKVELPPLTAVLAKAGGQALAQDRSGRLFGRRQGAVLETVTATVRAADAARSPIVLGRIGPPGLGARFQSDALHLAGCDRDHTVLGGRGDAALPEVTLAAAAPGDDAAVLEQGEAVVETGRDRGHVVTGRGGDPALPEVTATAAAPGHNAAVIP